jgi:hypothetical protein
MIAPTAEKTPVEDAASYGATAADIGTGTWPTELRVA